MPPRKSRILYVGNSFTTRNDLPSLLAGLAAADGKGTMVEHEVVAVGGASLRQHLNSGKAAGLLERSHWNYVVLQEQSTLPVKNAARMHDNVRARPSLPPPTAPAARRGTSPRRALHRWARDRDPRECCESLARYGLPGDVSPLSMRGRQSLLDMIRATSWSTAVKAAAT